jgi:carbamate kinase
MLVRVEEALGKAYALPLEVCVAESEGELGYVLAQTLGNLCRERGAPRPIASLLTQVESIRTTRARASGQARGLLLRRGPGRGAAREGLRHASRTRGAASGASCPSPEPRTIIDVELVGVLLAMGAIVVAAGGGGIPVTRAVDGDCMASMP